MADMQIPPMVYSQMKDAIHRIKETTNSQSEQAWAIGLLDMLHRLEATEPVEPLVSARAMPEWNSRTPRRLTWFEGFTWIDAFTDEELHRISAAVPDFADRLEFSPQEVYELIYAIREGLKLCHEEPKSIGSTARFDELAKVPARQLVSPNPGPVAPSRLAANPSGGGSYYEVSDRLNSPKHNPDQQTRE